MNSVGSVPVGARRRTGISTLVVAFLLLNFDTIHWAVESPPIALHALTSPVIFQGDAHHAYRDPAALYHDGWFHLYFTLVEIEAGGQTYSYLASSRSQDLQRWEEPRRLTPRDQHLNYGSPGNIVRFGDQWVLCLQTYPRPNGEPYGNETARLWTMRSRDLLTWDEPELLRVKGPDVPREAMGRMIDPCLIESVEVPGVWWCFFKQNGMSRSWSHDLKTWHFVGSMPAGENACLLRDGAEYVLFHSPKNGIGMKRSPDLQTWKDAGTTTLGQSIWPWAAGRLTAGFVCDLRQHPSIGYALLFFHGSQYPEKDPRGGFDNHASIGVAWSTDLRAWDWPGKIRAKP